MSPGEDLPGLPAAAAARWLQSVLPRPAAGQAWSAEVISGGLSNLTYRITWGGERLILRRPPLGPTQPGAHDMKREYRMMAALGPTPVPVPATVGYCADTGVLGVPFYVMREVPGTVIRSAEDAAALSPAQRQFASRQLVSVLSDLHAIDPAACGLARFGRGEPYAARQLRTWGQQWERTRTRELPDMDRLLGALGDAVPAEAREPTIVHGDYRLDNTVLADTEGYRIAAVLDWELATLGDPIADLATLLTFWHDRGDDERAQISLAAGITTAPGFLSSADIAACYAERTGRDLSSLNFYLALAAMKLGVILEGVHARYLNGKSVGAGYATVATAVPVLAARGLRLLGVTGG